MSNGLHGNDRRATAARKQNSVSGLARSRAASLSLVRHECRRMGSLTYLRSKSSIVAQKIRTNVMFATDVAASCGLFSGCSGAAPCSVTASGCSVSGRGRHVSGLITNICVVTSYARLLPRGLGRQSFKDNTAGSGTLCERATTRAHPVKAGAAKPRGQSDCAMGRVAMPAGLPNNQGEIHATVDPTGPAHAL